MFTILGVLCLVTQLCRTLCDPMDCSLPGSSIHGILQARILEWVAMPSSGNFPRDRIRVSCLLHWQEGSLPLALPGKPCRSVKNLMSKLPPPSPSLPIQDQSNPNLLGERDPGRSSFPSSPGNSTMQTILKATGFRIVFLRL